MATEIELQRRTGSGNLLPWTVNDDGSEPTRDVDAIAKLELIRALLGGVLDIAGTVGLDAASLAALENITAVISGTVALDGPTLAALEAITATVTGTVSVTNFPANQPVSGTVALDGPTLAALETITAVISGAVALDAATLAALETITVGGTVAVNNFPTNYPAPARRLKMDYAARADSQPVFLGSAPPASAEGDAVWAVMKFQYESASNDARLVGSDIRENIAWLSRTNPNPAWPF